MSKRMLLLILTVGLLSLILGAATISWFHDIEISRDNIFQAGTWTHDIAVTAINLSKTVVGQGFQMRINVTVQNQGNFTETFNVTSHANTTTIQTQTVINLASGDSRNITFAWNTTSIPYGNYTISAVADTITEEIHTDDNDLSNGIVIVTIPGDVNGDRNVDTHDLFKIGKAYSSTATSSNWNPNADINNDLIVNALDLDILNKNYGKAI